MNALFSSLTEGGCDCKKGGAKRKLSDYNKFMKKEMTELKKKYPSKPASECMKMAAKKWKVVKPKTTTSKKTSTKTRSTRTRTVK